MLIYLPIFPGCPYQVIFSLISRVNPPTSNLAKLLAFVCLVFFTSLWWMLYYSIRSIMRKEYKGNFCHDYSAIINRQLRPDGNYLNDDDALHRQLHRQRHRHLQGWRLDQLLDLRFRFLQQCRHRGKYFIKCPFFTNTVLSYIFPHFRVLSAQPCLE